MVSHCCFSLYFPMTNDVDIFMFLLAIYISSSVKCIIQKFCLFKKCYLFSNWVEKVKWVKSFSRVRLFATPWTVAYQTLPIVGFSRQEYWSGCHFLLQGIFPTQGSNLGLPHCRQTLYPLSYQGSPWKNKGFFTHTGFDTFYFYVIKFSYIFLLQCLLCWQ